MESDDTVDKNEPDMDDIPELGNEPDAAGDDVDMEGEDDLESLFGRSDDEDEHTPRGVMMRAWEYPRAPPDCPLYILGACLPLSPDST